MPTAEPYTVNFHFPVFGNFFDWFLQLKVFVF
jgi:hypothetical protein